MSSLIFWTFISQVGWWYYSLQHSSYFYFPWILSHFCFGLFHLDSIFLSQWKKNILVLVKKHSLFKLRCSSGLCSIRVLRCAHTWQILCLWLILCHENDNLGKHGVISKQTHLVISTDNEVLLGAVSVRIKRYGIIC